MKSSANHCSSSNWHISRQSSSESDYVQIRGCNFSLENKFRSIVDERRAVNCKSIYPINSIIFLPLAIKNRSRFVCLSIFLMKAKFFHRAIFKVAAGIFPLQFLKLSNHLLLMRGKWLFVQLTKLALSEGDIRP